MGLWPFSKEKKPPVTLSKGYYLTVLSSKPTLPPLLQILEPKGEGGAVVGMGAPLSDQASKDSLQKPMVRGIYALASLDRKTVLRLMVMPRDEAGFSPEAVERSPLSSHLPQEILARIRGTWMVLQFSFESYDPQTYPALDFLWNLARRTAELTDGVIADPLAQRYLLPDQAKSMPPDDSPVDAALHVSVRMFEDREGKLTCHTCGLAKFDLPELEMTNVSLASAQVAQAFLLSASQLQLLGRTLRVGEVFGSRKAPFQIAEGGHDLARWEGIACYDLLPRNNANTDAALKAWADGLEADLDEG
ncbi:MAG: hypothetical protein QY327_07155 [Fimbriimonadaceae bacterium]|nr:MAG: hypothetical protein UZ18_ATM001000154 [Armatimonadetes bacterium OLB18]WKZ79114.1 MAG: hypothetical protein QY327_07155 [Fimbriimonadaceae bacterium]